MPQTFNCPNCNAPLTYDGKSATITCEYCRTSVIVPPELRGEPADTISSNPPADILQKWSEIQQLALSGKKIEAIKLMRKIIDIRLQEAKDAVDNMQAGNPVDIQNFKIITSHSPVMAMDSEAYEQIRLLLKEGNKVQAIKLYRERMDTGLIEAKDAVDAMEIGFNGLEGIDQSDLSKFSTTDTTTENKVAISTGTVSVGRGCLATAPIVFIFLVTVVPILIAMASNGGPLSEPWARINPFSRAQLITSFGGEGTGTGLFQDPRYVATDNNGHLFVGEYSGGRIQIFDMDGKFLNQWTPDHVENDDLYLRGMAVDRSGMIYLVASGELNYYNAITGEQLGEIPSPTENGYFDDIFIGADSTLYATDTYHDEDILRFNRNRQLTLTIQDAISSITDETESTIRLSVDGQGIIYALGTSSESVFVFSPNGRYVTRFGSEGDEKGQFTSTYTLAVDNQSRVYVTDSGGLQVFSSDGRYLYKIGMPAYVYGLSFTDDNHLLTVSSDNKVRLWKIK